MKEIKICLDAGHYGKYNRSPAVKSYYESEMTWKLHLYLKNCLENYGFIVTQTRNDQAKDMEVYKRGKCAKGCDLLLSIHSNAVSGGVDENIDHPVVYVPINKSGDEIGKLLSNCIAKIMNTEEAPEVKTKKGNNGDYYGVIRGATAVGVPGLILEHSFHTNTRSTNWLLNDNNLKKLAQAEADVIAKYYGIDKEEESNNNCVEIKLPALKKGAKGNAVRALQILLIGYGYSCGKYGADGSFGSSTLSALKEYQKDNDLGVDGICGQKTWTKLLGV